MLKQPFELELEFTKLFSYVKTHEWILPEVQDVFATSSIPDHELMEQKKLLNKLKSSLNDFDIKIWNKHTQFVNPAGKILQAVRRDVNPELPTQAWCKFYEILSYADVIPHSCKSTIFAMHLCEAPGGFICSLNHYLKSHQQFRGVKFHWVANALNPYYEGNSLDHCILDDRLICNTLRSWYFGNDNTGDIMQPDFIAGLQSHCNNNLSQNCIDIVTADGSFNCQNQPAEQETVVAHLKYTEMFTALHFLCHGGTLVMKMFTLFEHHSVCLIYLLCCWFDSVSVTKPASSKAGNSEVYIVARGYCGLGKTMEYLKKLKEFHPFQTVIKENCAMIPCTLIPKSFLKQHVECTTMFAAHQKAAINRNLYYYSHRSSNDTAAIKNLQHVFTQQYFDVCELRRLPRKYFIAKSPVLKSHLKQIPRLEGTFGQRITPLSVPFSEAEGQNKCDQTAMAFRDISFMHMPPNSIDTAQVCIKSGKELNDIKSSLYCTTDIIVRYISAASTVQSRNLLSAFTFEQACTTSDFLANKLIKELCSCTGSVIEIEVIPGVNQIGQHFKSTVFSNMSSQQYHSVSLSDVSNKCCTETHPILIVSFMVLSDFSKWPELSLRSCCLQVIMAVIKSLCNQDSCLLVLPSVLTRLVAHALWFLCQYFSEIMLQPISLRTSPPAVMFVGKSFHARTESQTSVLLNVIQSALERLGCDDGTDALELLPATKLVVDEGRKETIHEHFATLLKHANEFCFEQLTAKFENLINV